ncbi:MAG: hypothetical protein JOZ36_14465 [Acidobacteria bacterium]|nr:hypothetical protein [Acidobacteriota bacterium]
MIPLPGSRTVESTLRLLRVESDAAGDNTEATDAAQTRQSIFFDLRTPPAQPKRIYRDEDCSPGYPDLGAERDENLVKKRANSLYCRFPHFRRSLGCQPAYALGHPWAARPEFAVPPANSHSPPKEPFFGTLVVAMVAVTKPT